MIRKLSMVLIIALFVQCFQLSWNERNVSAEEIATEEEIATDLTPDAKSAILMDMDTGSVLFEKNSDVQLPPASITKIMSMLLIMEAIQSEQISWTDKVRISERAASMGGSQIFLEAGEEMTVEDLMKGIAIASGNDATVAMAEYIAGTEEQFIQMMNEKAQELGMENTNFMNTNGLPVANHHTSARDIAIMSRELLKHEDVTRFTSIYEDYLRKESDRPFWLVNTNRLVKFYDGVDGLKTGYTQEAQYCLAATAKIDEMRVIAVVMGTPSPKVRNGHITQMFDYAFSQYESHPIHKEGEVLDTVKVDKGEKTSTPLIAPYQIGVLTRKGESLDAYESVIHTSSYIDAPIQIGEPLGQVQILKEDKLEVEVDISSTEEIARSSLWQLLKRTSLRFFGTDEF